MGVGGARACATPAANYGPGMKIPVFFLGLTMIAGVALAQTAKPAEPADGAAPVDETKPVDAAKPTDVTKPADTVKPGTPAKPAKPEAKKEEPMGVIEGITITRPNGTFLGLTLVEGKFKLTFYNKKKKPIPVDVTRGVARWPNVHGPGDNRTILNSDGGNSLVGAQFVRGPYAFILFITLLKGEGDTAEAVENYTVQFRD